MRQEVDSRDEVMHSEISEMSDITQFLQTTSEIIPVWTIFLFLTACMTMQFVPPTALYKLSCLHYCTLNYIYAVK